MSIPQSDTQPSHHVVRMVYDKHSMGKFFAISIFFSILMMFILFYTLSVIDDQSKQITELSKVVNQLSFKGNEFTINKLETQETKDLGQNNRYDSLPSREISHVLELYHKELKKIYAFVNKMEHELTHDLKTVKMLLEEQKQSSWQMKEIISSLKKKIQSIGQAFENIDLGSMGQKIKGTFNDIKDKVGSMFENGEETKNEKSQDDKTEKDEQSSEGYFSRLKNKVKRKMQSWRTGQQQQQQL